VVKELALACDDTVAWHLDLEADAATFDIDWAAMAAAASNGRTN